MTTTTICPGCFGTAELLPNGVLVCDDGTDRFEMTPADVDGIVEAQALAATVSAARAER